MRSYKKPAYQQNIAEERIRELFRQAELRKSYADRYVELARKISMRYKVPIPSELKRRFCKACYKYIEGIKRVRTKKEHVVMTCPHCNHHMRFPIKAMR